MAAMKRDPGYRVRLSQEGLRRAYGDNALYFATSKRNERLHGVLCWLTAFALALFLGWSAAQTMGIVS